jgi:hypothetical protein
MALDVFYTISEFRRVILTKNPELLKELMDAVF